MFGDDSRALLHNPAHPYDARSFETGGQRRIALVANGRRHGPITRLITPWDIGELTRPFVLLNYAEVERRSRALFGSHPPSRITTLALVLNGELSFEDSTGKRGEVAAAGFAWMKAGSTLWHESRHSVHEPLLRMFQLWIAQLGAQTACAAASECIAPNEVEQHGPVRVLLGEFGRARSRLRQAPADLNLFHVQLKDRQHFRYTVPDGHVTWLAVDRGTLQLQAGERALWEQVVLFGDCADTVEAQADGETSFLLGSARRGT